MKIGILIITGFQQPDYRTETAGLWKLLDRICEIFDSRKIAWIAIRKFDSDQCVEDAKEVVRQGCDRIITISYSWGNGVGLLAFADGLAKLKNAQGIPAPRSIDLAMLIDPVPHGSWWRPLAQFWNAMVPHTEAFILPANIIRAAVWRTLNYRSMTRTPFGRDIAAAAGAATVIVHRVVFGSAVNLDKYPPQSSGDFYNDAAVDHCSIDDDERVHDGIVAEMTLLNLLMAA